MISFEWCVRLVGRSRLALLVWLRDGQTQNAIEQLAIAPLGINVEWYFRQWLWLGPWRPFHTTALPLATVTSIGLIFLLLARLVIVRRAAPRPQHRIRRSFQWLDRVFGRLNDRLAIGLTLGRLGDDLPGDNPVAWRELRRGNLGRANYLVRVLILFELPVLLSTAAYVTTTRDLTFSRLNTSALLLWLIAILVVLVRSAGLIAGEKARQTLDPLLATPLLLAEVAGAKMRGLWRVMAIVAVPILLHAILVGYLQGSYGARRWSYYRLQGFDAITSSRFYVVVAAVNLVILLGLSAQLAFLFGLRARTQGHALTAVLGVLAEWCFIPLFVRMFADTGGWTLYLSPISGLLTNEYPEFSNDWWLRAGTETGRWGFYLLIHCGIYAALVLILAWVNQRLAARVLLRPATQPTIS
jgi:hypothetical protein